MRLFLLFTTDQLISLGDATGFLSHGFTDEADVAPVSRFPA